MIFFCRSWIVFCLISLVTSTDKHENKHHQRYHHISRHHEKKEADGTTQSLVLTTPEPSENTSPKLENYEGLNLIFRENEKLDYVGFANTSENVALLVIPQKHEYKTFLIDSRTGKLIVFKNLDNIELVKDDGLKGDIVPISKNIIDKYECHNLTIPGERTKISSDSEEGLSLLSHVYLHLGHPENKDNKYRSFEFIKKAAGLIRHIFTGPLKKLLHGQGPLPLRQNLNRFHTITGGLIKLFKSANGGLKIIVQAGIKFDLNRLYNAKNGIEVFVYILRETGKKFDLSTLWGGLLNDIEKLLQIIVMLGGGESKNGADETLALIAHIWAALNLRLPLPSLVTYLTQAASEEVWSQEDGDFTSALNDLKNITDEQSKKYDNGLKISPFVTFVTNLTTKNLVHNKVNISDLIVKFRKRDIVGGLHSVVDILMQLTSTPRIHDWLFDAYLAFLNSSSDPDALKRLTPGLSLDKIAGGSGSIWQKICKSYDVDKLLKTNPNANEVLKNVPAFNEFSKILSGSHGSPFDFNKVLQGKSISEYLVKLVTVTPIKWGYETLVKIIRVPQEIVKHIWNPLGPWIPGWGKGSTGIPLSKITIFPEPEKLEKESERPTTEKECEGDCEPKEGEEPFTLDPIKEGTEDESKATAKSTTKKECDDCENEDEEEKKKTTTEKECDDCKEKEEKPKGEKDCESDCDDQSDSKDIESRRHLQHKHAPYVRHHNTKHHYHHDENKPRRKNKDHHDTKHHHETKKHHDVKKSHNKHHDGNEKRRHIAEGDKENHHQVKKHN